MAFGPRLQARILSFVASLRARGADVDRPVLYAVYGNDIMARLARIHAHPERDGPHGMLVVALRGRTPAYVRCAFADNGETLLCDACAGAYPQEPNVPRRPVSAAMEEALKNAGYWLDQASGRFIFNYEIGPNPDSDVWGGVSVAVLKPLIDVFGAHARSRIDITAPLVPG